MCSRSRDEILAQRIRRLLARLPGFVEKRKFGGIGFIVHGSMAWGVHSGEIIVRVGPDRHAESLAWPHARQFDMTARLMRGWVTVAQSSFAAKEDPRRWIQWRMD